MNLYGFGPIRDHLGSRQPAPQPQLAPQPQPQPGPPAPGPAGVDIGAAGARRRGRHRPGEVRHRPGPGAVSAGLCGFEGRCLLNIQYRILNILYTVEGIQPIETLLNLIEPTAPIEY